MPFRCRLPRGIRSIARPARNLPWRWRDRTLQRPAGPTGSSPHHRKCRSPAPGHTVRGLRPIRAVGNKCLQGAPAPAGNSDLWQALRGICLLRRRGKTAVRTHGLADKARRPTRGRSFRAAVAAASAACRGVRNSRGCVRRGINRENPEPPAHRVAAKGYRWDPAPAGCATSLCFRPMSPAVRR